MPAGQQLLRKAACYEPTILSHTKPSVSVDTRSGTLGGGSDTDMGVTDGVNVSRVCVCVYDTQTIVECKQSAAHIDSQDSQ